MKEETEDELDARSRFSATVVSSIYIYVNFQISGKLILIRRGSIFPKVVRLENDAEPYRRNILGPNFQKRPLIEFKGLWFVNLRSWYQDLSTKILVPILVFLGKS